LRPHTTIIIAEDGIKPPFPFDLNHIAIRQYRHMGEDIGYSEVMRFRELLTSAIKTITAKQPPDCDSPVHTFLDLRKSAAAATKATSEKRTAAIAPAPSGKPFSARMKQVDDAEKREQFSAAKDLLKQIWEEMKAEDAARATVATVTPNESIAPPKVDYSSVIQRLARLTYKSESPSKHEALDEARNLLAQLEPETSNDTETLGLWGAVHKRRWELTRDVADLDQAVRSYERGFYLRNDHYNGINFAFLLNVRAAHTHDPAEAIADFICAQRVRREVLQICVQWLAANPPPDEEASVKTMNDYLERKYWVVATQAEAFLGMGDIPKAEQIYAEAYSTKLAGWMVKSTTDQRKALEKLLADSPLKHLKA
jgi:hypothetical protein